MITKEGLKTVMFLSALALLIVGFGLVIVPFMAHTMPGLEAWVIVVGSVLYMGLALQAIGELRGLLEFFECNIRRLVYWSTTVGWLLFALAVGIGLPVFGILSYGKHPNLDAILVVFGGLVVSTLGFIAVYVMFHMGDRHNRTYHFAPGYKRKPFDWLLVERRKNHGLYN